MADNAKTGINQFGSCNLSAGKKYEADDNNSVTDTDIPEEMDSSSSSDSCIITMNFSNTNMEDVPVVYDEAAYIFYCQATVAPCLSFDVIKDNFGNDRSDTFPLTMNIVCGTQSEKCPANNLIVMRMSNINKSEPPDASNGDEGHKSDDKNEDSAPVLSCALVKHSGCVNRIRATSFGGKPIAASWSERGRVFLWDLSTSVAAVNNHPVTSNHAQNIEDIHPLFSFSGHLSEGFAMDWSTLLPGVLATGDCKRNIHLWKPLDGGSWFVEQKPLSAHTASVEDIQWSPNESNVLASCSVDKSIRIWDTRVPVDQSCVLTVLDAHDSDVNVINWSKLQPLILSGGDDEKVKVWDIRHLLKHSPMFTFNYHAAPITSVEWHPNYPTVFASSSDDDHLMLWDLAMTGNGEDENLGSVITEESYFPSQALFIHKGQKQIKEIHWHSQMPGVLISTTQTGFDIFRTLSV